MDKIIKAKDDIIWGLILEKNKKNTLDYDKAALKFILDHKRGSLATVLNMMSDCNLNLTKIQSLPVIQTPGKYAFFVDITFKSIENYKNSLLLSRVWLMPRVRVNYGRPLCYPVSFHP